MRDFVSLNLEAQQPRIVAMVHVGALPGTPRSRHSLGDIVRQAAAEAKVLEAGGE